MIIALALAGCAGSPGPSPVPAGGASSSPVTNVVVSTGACGQGWTATGAGRQRFRLRNTDTRPGEVYLVDAATGGVVASVDDLGPGTVTPMTVDLGGGRYRFECVMEDAAVVRGAVVAVAGAPGVAGVRPVSMQDLIPATKAYEAYVRKQLPNLVTLVDRLDRDVRADRLARARHDWLAAHLAYERLGAAYGAFGDVDDAVNGRAAGLQGGVRDSRFTGFHRIEYGLWHGQPAVQIRPYTAGLVRDVRDLARAFASARIDPLDVSIRAHEITENALQFELSGRSDYGSGSALATVRANLDGTRVVLNLLRPLLAPRYPAARLVDHRISRTMADLEAIRRHGTWPSLAALSRSQREQIDADVSELTELLAPVASILEPRRTS